MDFGGEVVLTLYNSKVDFSLTTNVTIQVIYSLCS
ncbi:unnamed protein product [Arabidopsis halleri]